MKKFFQNKSGGCLVVSVICSLTAISLVAAVYIYPILFTGDGFSNLTKSNILQVREGMTLAELEDLLGKDHVLKLEATSPLGDTHRIYDWVEKSEDGRERFVTVAIVDGRLSYWNWNQTPPY